MKPPAYSRYADIAVTIAIQKGLGEGESLIAVVFNCALEYAMRKVQADQEGLKMVHITFWSMQVR